MNKPLSFNTLPYIHLIEVCADYKIGEKIFIIANEETLTIAEKLLHVSKKYDPNASLTSIPTAKFAGVEPPDEVAEQMLKSDIVFSLAKKSLAHTTARHNATERGTKFLSLPEYDEDVIQSNAILFDYKSVTELSFRLEHILTQGNTITITSEKGTNLTAKLAGRKGNAAPGWCFTKGALASPPDAEVNIAPLEFETNGVIVVDGSIPGIGLLDMPITLTLKHGKIISFSGSKKDLLIELFSKCNDEKALILGEIGFGLNEKATLTGKMLEDEGSKEVIHFGFGSNSTIGGINKVNFHLDHMVRKCTVFIDDFCLINHGNLNL